MASAEASELSRMEIMEGVDPSHVAKVAALMGSGRIEAGQELGHQGEPGATFYLILQGRVSVEVDDRGGRRQLAEVGPGSLVGELALLRSRPRSATLLAETDLRYLSGGIPALEALLDIPLVLERIRRLSGARLAEAAPPVRVALRDGTPALLRPLLPSDRLAYEDALHRLSAESMRRRFLSSGAPSSALVDYLLDLDFVNRFAWVALAPGGVTGMATARYARHPGDTAAEMAFTTVDEFQRRGLATIMLGILGATASECGIGLLTAYVMHDNLAMRAVFAKAEATSRFDEPGLLLVEIDPGKAARLLDERTRRAVAAMANEVILASGSALA